ncbi:MAG TPA: shikimate dehydrogenase [Vicinamibacterales bacterium]|nr:shikimate dehydrogenase [Vicinamibacterales bacterium]
MPERSQLCVTVTAATTAELCQRRDAAVREFAPDLVELRIDGIGDLQLERVIGDGARCIVTCRPEWEGGRYSGDESARRALLLQALALGAQFVDVEHRAAFAVELIAAGQSRVVLSYHDFKGIPDDLPSIARQMRDANPGVVKIAVTAERLADCATLLNLSNTILAQTSKVLIAMGPHGLTTRVLAARLGSAWSYAGSLADLGQVGAASLLSDFRFRSLSSSTILYGLTGSPIGHSVSPAMHNRAIADRGLDAVYLPLPALDADDFVAYAEAFGLAGASVTIPFKVPLAAKADEVDDVARRVGAINTMKRNGGRWIATNTDVAGFLRPLEQRGVRLPGVRASILGAGGSARAVAVALTGAGARVRIHARDAQRASQTASATASEVGSWPVESGSWDLLVNCTPVGMYPHVDESPLPSLRHESGGGRIVYDLIYNPQTTRLIHEARQAGCQVIGGLEMLVAQAEEQFAFWTGRPPARGIMREAALTRLAEFESHENHVV